MTFIILKPVSTHSDLSFGTFRFNMETYFARKSAHVCDALCPVLCVWVTSEASNLDYIEWIVILIIVFSKVILLLLICQFSHF